MAKGLTDTAKAARDQAQSGMSVFDRPTQWTRNALYLKAANKSSAVMEATVGVKPSQAEYLIYQIEGGLRAPKKQALRLPTEIQLDESGNLPRGVIKKLIERAKAGRRLTKAQSKKSGVSSNVDLFYGDPKDSRPPGIYMRVSRGAGRQSLVPVIVFPKQSAKYKKRYDFYGIAQRAAQQNLAQKIEEAWRYALSTAK